MRKSVKKGDLAEWLDQASVSTATSSKKSSTAFTEFSDLTQTTQDSSKSEPIRTHHNRQFRHHKRGVGINKNNWRATDAHASTNNVPDFGWPDPLRFQTTIGHFFGKIEKGSRPINEKMYQSVFKDENHPFIKEYLAQTSPRERNAFCEIARCLENYRFTKAYKTAHQQQFNMKEQGRLWFPNKAKPREKSAVMTQVPLGTIGEMLEFHRENQGLQTMSTRPKTPLDLPKSKADILTLDSARPTEAASVQNEDQAHFLPPLDCATP